MHARKGILSMSFFDEKLEKTGIFFIIAFIASLFYMDFNREVAIHICEKDSMTKYIGRTAPSKHLKVGNCHVEVMKNKKYYELKAEFKRVR